MLELEQQGSAETVTRDDIQIPRHHGVHCRAVPVWAYDPVLMLAVVEVWKMGTRLIERTIWPG